jgi:long-subunit fatty acid transport protein
MALVLAPVGAGEANYQPYIVGERAPGMGGAVCATAEGMDAAFYNPAGLGRVQRNSISVNGTFYGLQHYKTDDTLFPGEALGVDSFITIPAGISGVNRLGANAVGAFSVFVPSQSSAKEIRAFAEREHFYNSSYDEQTLWAGPSLGYQVNDRLTLGASVFVVYQNVSQFNNLYWGDYAYSYAVNYDYASWGLLAAIGAQYRLAEHWSVGLTVLSPSLALYGTGRWQEHAVLSDGSARNADSIYLENLDAVNGLPTQLKLGVAWQLPRKITLGADVTHHFARSYDVLSHDEEALRRHRQAITDVQAGAEYYINGRFPVRAGAFTSFSAAPDVDPSDKYAMPHVDLYGLTASVGLESEHLIVNAGLNYIFGSGEALGRTFAGDKTLQGAVTHTGEQALYFFLSTAYLF